MKKLTYILFAALILLNTLFLCGCNNGVSKDTSLSENNRFAEGYYVNYSQEPMVAAFNKGANILGGYYNVQCSVGWSKGWSGEYVPDMNLGDQEIPLTINLTNRFEDGEDHMVLYVFYNFSDNTIYPVSGYMDEGNSTYELDKTNTDDFIMSVLQPEFEM